MINLRLNVWKSYFERLLLTINNLQLILFILTTNSDMPIIHVGSLNCSFSVLSMSYQVTFTLNNAFKFEFPCLSNLLPLSEDYLQLNFYCI